MSQISKIKYKDIQEARRFDAEYFKSVYVKNNEIILKNKWDICKNLVTRDITKGETPLWQGFSYIKEGVPFVRSQNFKGFGIDKEDLVFVSNKYNNLKKRSIIESRDTLLAIVGATIGEVGFYDLNERGNCNQAVAIISPKKDISKEYFNILFRTKNIQYQIKRAQGGNARDNFDLFEVRHLKVPILSEPFQLQIEKIVKNAHQKQKESKKLHKEAEEILLNELGLLNYEIKNILTFRASKKQIEQAERFDAEYFQPKYGEIIKKIEGYEGGVDIVGNVLHFNKKNFFPKENESYNYIPLSRVSSGGEIDIVEKELGRDLPTRARRKLKVGEIVLSSIEGSLETSALIGKEHDGFISSNGFYVFSSKKINSETLLVLFKSQIILQLLKRISKGAILGGYDLKSFEQIKIPLIKPQVQTEITEKIQASHRLRKESKELLEEAKRKVEEEIEKK
jgi:restriction endonuclease S subunit